MYKYKNLLSQYSLNLENLKTPGPSLNMQMSRVISSENLESKIGLFCLYVLQAFPNSLSPSYSLNWDIIQVPSNSPFKSRQFSGFKYSHEVVQPSLISNSRTFHHSPRKETSHTLAVNPQEWEQDHASRQEDRQSSSCLLKVTWFSEAWNLRVLQGWLMVSEYVQRYSLQPIVIYFKLFIFQVESLLITR